MNTGFYILPIDQQLSLYHDELADLEMQREGYRPDDPRAQRLTPRIADLCHKITGLEALVAEARRSRAA